MNVKRKTQTSTKSLHQFMTNLKLLTNAIKTILSTYHKTKNVGAPDIIVRIINEAITNYGVIDNRRLKEILKENLQ